MKRHTVLAAVVLASVWSAPAAALDLSRLSELIDAWMASPHGDLRSPSFTHWNSEGAVPTNCAACHSGPGFVDFLGADGTAAGVVDHPAPMDSPIGCVACHTSAAHALDRVTFPSGAVADGLGASATCMVCHQGRQSSEAVERSVADRDEDVVSGELAFFNIHYRAAAATLLGAEARGGYQYPGKGYAGRLDHVPSADTCAGCHDPHTTEVATEGCFSCHRGADRLAGIRTQHADFDGDGDRAGGIHAEIVGLHRRLLEAMKAYASEVAGTPVAYAPGRNPYFFADTDGDGQASEAEAVRDNRYQSWTPRLLKAAYNYQFVAADPGGYSHNPTYMLQLLHDSLQSLSQRVAVDVSGLARP